MPPKRKSSAADGPSGQEQPAKKAATEGIDQTAQPTQAKSSTGKKRGRPPKAIAGGWTSTKTLPPNKEVALEWNAANERSQVRQDFEDSLIKPANIPQDCDWTVADETNFQQLSRQLPINADYPEDGHMLKLWKDCYRFHDCTPFDLLPPEMDLQYGGGGELWSENFCELMRKLMFFPPFVDDKAMMAVVIQYAVICRTRDCRAWFPNVDDLLHRWFVVHWKTVANERNDPPWVIHRLIRDKLMTTNAQRNSVPTIILTSLERLCDVDGQPKEGTQATGAYAVTEEDLDNLLKVMTTVAAYGGVPLYLDWSVYDQYAGLSGAKNGQPERQLINTYVNAIIPKIRRRVAIRRKHLTSVGRSDFAPPALARQPTTQTGAAIPSTPLCPNETPIPQAFGDAGNVDPQLRPPALQAPAPAFQPQAPAFQRLDSQDVNIPTQELMEFERQQQQQQHQGEFGPDAVTREEFEARKREQQQQPPQPQQAVPPQPGLIVYRHGGQEARNKRLARVLNEVARVLREDIGEVQCDYSEQDLTRNEQ